MEVYTFISTLEGGPKGEPPLIRVDNHEGWTKVGSPFRRGDEKRVDQRKIKKICTLS